MAADADISLQKQLIYSIYVRNHTPEGTFRSIIPDLDYAVPGSWDYQIESLIPILD